MRPNQRCTRLEPKSALSATSAGDGPSSAAVRRLPAHERDVDLRHLVVAELQVTDAAPVVVRRFARAANERADAAGRDCGLALREHARLRRSDAGDVAHRVHARELRLEGHRVDRDPAVDGHARLRDHLRHPVRRHAEEEVVRHLGAVTEHRHPARRVEPAHQRLRVPVDPPLLERGQQRLRRVGRRRDREPATA